MRTHRPHAMGLVALAAALVITAGACNPPPPPLPVSYNVTAALPYVLQPDKAPAGSNDPNCKPSSAHPYPVILVPGTFATMGENYATLSPLLKNNGYCVFTFNYGRTSFTDATGGNITSIGPIADSAAELKTFVNQVRSWTGAAKVDIVGHSQGGMMPNYYIQFLGGASRVHTLVGIAPSNHGTTLNGLVTFAQDLGSIWPGLLPYVNNNILTSGGLPALVDQQVGSPFMQLMATKPDTAPGVNYTVIATRNDEVVTPYSNGFLSGPNVTNITVQDKCILDQADHVAIIFDHVALQYVLNALDPAHAKTPLCTPVLPLVGG